MRPRRRIRRRRARGRRAPRAPASSWRKARDAFERTRPRISMLGVSRAQTRDTTHSETSPPPRPGRRHRCHPRMPRARANDHAGRDWAFSESREPREESRTCRLPTNFGETNAICRSRKTRRVLSNFPSVHACLSFIAVAADEAKRYQTNLRASSCHLSSAPLDNITPGAHLRAGPPRSPLCLRPWRRRP
jgi:hypothetical protein